MAVHRGGFYFVIFGTFLLYLGAISLDVVALTSLFGIENAILPSNPWDIYESIDVNFSFPSWLFVLEVVIVAWQLIWLGYGLSTLCRKDLASGLYLYYSPPFLPITMYAMFGTGMIAKIAWIFAYSYEYIEFALGFQALLSFTLFMSMVLGTVGLSRHSAELARSGQLREIQLARGLVHNGLAFYSGYNDFIVTGMLQKVLVKSAGLDDSLAAIIVYSVLLTSIVLFFIIEITAWDKHARYVVMHYVPIIIGLISVTTVSFDGLTWDIPHYLILVSLVTAFIGFIGRLIAICVRDMRLGDRLRTGGMAALMKK